MRNRKIFHLLIILTLVSLMGLHVQAAAKVRLYFKAEVEVSGSRMILGQMIQMDGDAALIQRLMKADIGPAPEPGKKITLTKDLVLGNLRQQGFNTLELELVDFPAKGITVKGAMQLVSQEQVMAKVYDYIYSQLPQRFSSVEVKLKTQFPKIALPPGDYQIQVGPHRSSKIWGYLSLPISIIKDDKEYDRESLSLDVRVFQKVFVAVTSIERMATITSDMIMQKYMDVTELAGDPVEAGEAVVGKVAIRSIATGNVIMKNYLEIPKVVHRNDKVTIDVFLGSIHVQAFGKASQDGAIGDLIEVTNLDSGIKIRATVTGAGQVRALME